MSGGACPSPVRHHHTYDEYLTLERDSGLKHEFDGGVIVALLGGSLRHNALASLIVEVLSPSTEEEDRSGKWQHYQLIPSLREYVLVSQGQPRIESYRRLPSGAWEYRDVTEGVMTLLSGATLDLAALYGDLPA